MNPRQGIRMENLRIPSDACQEPGPLQCVALAGNSSPARDFRILPEAPEAFRLTLMPPGDRGAKRPARCRSTTPEQLKATAHGGTVPLPGFVEARQEEIAVVCGYPEHGPPEPVLVFW